MAKIKLSEMITAVNDITGQRWDTSSIVRWLNMGIQTISDYSYIESDYEFDVTPDETEYDLPVDFQDDILVKADGKPLERSNIENIGVGGYTVWGDKFHIVVNAPTTIKMYYFARARTFSQTAPDNNAVLNIDENYQYIPVYYAASISQSRDENPDREGGFYQRYMQQLTNFIQVNQARKNKMRRLNYRMRVVRRG